MSKSYPNWFYQRFTDLNGMPLSGGKIFAYRSGTTTPLATYNGGDVANPYPVVLDSSGMAIIKLLDTEVYRIDIKDANDVLLHTYQDVKGSTYGTSGGTGDYLPSSGNATFTGNLSVTQALESDTFEANTITIGGVDVNGLFVSISNHNARSIVGNASSSVGNVADISLVDDIGSGSSNVVPSTKAVFDAVASADHYTVKVEATDADSYLINKVSAGAGINVALGGSVGSRTVKITNTQDAKIKINATDTTAGYLADKLIAGTNVAITTVGETLVLSTSGSVVGTGVAGRGARWADATTLDAGDIYDPAQSTGILTFVAPYIAITSATEFTVAPVTGYIIKHNTQTKVLVNYAGGTLLTTPYALTNPATYLCIDATGALVMLPDSPTPIQRRSMITLGRIVHKAGVLNVAVVNPDIAIDEMSQLRDFFHPIKYINEGVAVSPNGANLAIDIVTGTLNGLGANWMGGGASDPVSLVIPASSAVTFQYRTQTDATTGNVTAIDPLYYDVAGTRTAIAGNNNQATNQRLYISPNGLVRVLYGQTVYATLSAALGGSQTESFTVDPTIQANLQLVGILSVRKGATNLTLATDAKFIPVSMFGELTGGTAGSSTTTLQQSYNNSTEPEIITDDTHGALSIRRGTSGSDTDTVFEVCGGTGQPHFWVNGDGYTNTDGDVFINKVTDAYLTVGAENGTKSTVVIQGLTGTEKRLLLGTGIYGRWGIVSNNVAEGGANAGSNFEIRSYSDLGVFISTALSIDRAAGGNLTLNRPTIATDNLNLTKIATPAIYVGANASTNPQLLLNGTGARTLRMQTAGVDRWWVNCNNVAEGGANAGSSFEINAYTDAGVLIDKPMSIARAAGGNISLRRNTELVGVLYSNSANGGVFGYTNDGADNFSATLSSTTGQSPSRGGYIVVKGNEVATNGGDILIEAGQGVAGDIIMRTNNLERMRITKAGEIAFQSAESHLLRSVATAGATTTALATDYLIVFTGTLTQTYTLPATGATSRQIIVKNRSTGIVTVNRAGADTIDGGTTFALATNQCLTLISASTDWCII